MTEKERQNSAQPGQGLVEYSLILVLISVVAIVGLIAMAPALYRLYELAVNQVPTV